MFKTPRKCLQNLALATLLLVAVAAPANAGTATGVFAFLNIGNDLYNTFNTAVVGWIAFIALVVAGGYLIFGNPGAGMVRVLWTVVGVSFLGTLPTILSTLGVTSLGATLPLVS